MSVSIAQLSADAKAGWLAAENDTGVPFGNGVHAVDDDATAPQDRGSDRPEEDGNERQAVADLKSMMGKRAARIERETGGTCRIDCLVSSPADSADGFLVVLTVDGHRGSGNAANRDDAELAARLEVSVKLAVAKRAAKGAVAL